MKSKRSECISHQKIDSHIREQKNIMKKKEYKKHTYKVIRCRDLFFHMASIISDVLVKGYRWEDIPYLTTNFFWLRPPDGTRESI